MKIGGRIIATLLIITFPQVVVCFVLFHQSQNNIYIIQAYSIVEFILLMFYYYHLLSKSWLRSVVAILAMIGICWFVITQFAQKSILHSFSFVLFEAFAITVSGSFYCLHLFLKEETQLTRLSNFWITVAILFYWTTTYTRNGLFIFHSQMPSYFSDILESFFVVTNILFYVALSVILVNRKEFIDTRE